MGGLEQLGVTKNLEEKFKKHNYPKNTSRARRWEGN